MSETPAYIAQIADEIGNGKPFSAHPTDPPRDMARAYADQDALHAYLMSSGRRTGVAGYKIAVNSKAQMAHFGIDEPASGRVYADQTSVSPAQRRVGDYTCFAFEPEIAAILGAPIDGTGGAVDRKQVIAAVERFVPALELIDLRNAKLPDVHLPDVIAQNITNAGAVIGGDGAAVSAVDPDTITTKVSVSGQSDVDVTGGAPQPPIDAVMWIVNHLGRRGISLEAGQFILCGTHIPMQRVETPARIVVGMSGLGRVELTLTG